MPATILPHELPTALDHAPAGMRVLSLDCFDTLLWRDCHAPSDVFADLPGLTVGQRALGEANARKAMRTLKNRSEVTLDDIYTQVMPLADAAARDAAIAAELEAEARACFAFAPTVQLMQAAKARGITVIIVSDTYLNAAQLRALIENAAGPEVAGLIDKVFASSDAGISKGEGLLGKAIAAMKYRAHEVLHIGDNRRADYESARALGIPALHLEQFEEATRQRLRFERSCHQMDAHELGGPAARIIGLQPHRALLAYGEPQIASAGEALGYSVLGPVFHAYDQWLRAEAEALENARGGQVHWLFMLRDGHLPDCVHGTGKRADSTGRVEISRYVATAASLSSSEAYHRHLAIEFGLNPATLARQMLLNEDEIAQIVGDPKTDRDMAEASRRLLKELRTGKREKLTARRARDMAERLVAHVRAAVDPQPGDTLMLIDLGYNGSAQNGMDALLRDAFGVHVAGRYLLCRERAATGLDKRGLIDMRHFDPGLIEAMCGTVAVIEQLATCDTGSVIGYRADGAPIRTNNTVKGGQSAMRDAVQAGAMRFACAAQQPPVIRTVDASPARSWRECAAQVLTRFMFLPAPHELAVLKSFEHDVNLGSTRMVALFDSDDAAAQMKRRGLFYTKGSSRMFLPADLATEDMNTRLSLLVQQRFGIAMTYDDCSPRTLEIPAFHIDAAANAATTIAARPTHDGYYVARIPLGPKGGGVALQIGAVCEWVEIDSVTRSSIASLKGTFQDHAAQPCRTVRYDDMEERAPGIFECCTQTALMLIVADPTADRPTGPHMIEIVFRPIRYRAGKDARTRSTPQLANPRTEAAA